VLTWLTDLKQTLFVLRTILSAVFVGDIGAYGMKVRSKDGPESGHNIHIASLAADSAGRYGATKIILIKKAVRGHQAKRRKEEKTENGRMFAAIICKYVVKIPKQNGRFSKFAK
jgi:hypothetical protein